MNDQKHTPPPSSDPEALFVISTYGDGASSTIVPESALEKAWLEVHFCPVESVSDEERESCLATLNDADEWRKENGIKMSLSVHYEDGAVYVSRITNFEQCEVIPDAEIDKLNQMASGAIVRETQAFIDMQAERDRLREVNAALLSALQSARPFVDSFYDYQHPTEDGSTLIEVDAAIARAEAK